MTRKLTIVTFALAALATSGFGQIETYQIDGGHSSVGFRVRHIVTPLPGTFAKVGGIITVDRGDLTRSSVTAFIEVASIGSGDERRDNALRGENFLHAEHHPRMTFASTAWKQISENTFEVTGNLTIKGITKPVVLATTLFGFVPAGNDRIVSGWEAKTTIDRREWGVSGGPAIVGNDVEILITIEARLE